MKEFTAWYVFDGHKVMFKRWECCSHVWEMCFKSDWFPTCPECKQKGSPWLFK